jgi:hypothetical protein
MVATPSEKQDVTASARDDHEEDVEDRECRYGRKRHDHERPGVRCDWNRHRGGSDQEAKRHAATVAEENTGRRGKVEEQEARACARNRQSERGELGGSADCGDESHARGRDGSDRARGAVHVVHQVEGVDEAYDPEHGEHQAERVRPWDRPAEVRAPNDDGHGDRHEHAAQRAQPDAVVRRSDDPQCHGAQSDRAVLHRSSAEQDGCQRDAAANRHTAEVRSRPLMTLIATWVVEEAKAPRDGDRERRR